MIFSELYSAYYKTVAEILKAAIDHPLQKNEMSKIIRRHAFEESQIQIEPAFEEGRWQLLRSDGSTPIYHTPSMPLTVTQKQWLKAISTDPRIRLIEDELIDYPDVEPLFTSDDYTIFDRFSDGDNYEDEIYRRNFRQVLESVRNHYYLYVEMISGRGREESHILYPLYLEYSEKDDKFRLVSLNKEGEFQTVNVGRIKKCSRYTEPFEMGECKRLLPEEGYMEFEVTNHRNALERVLMHFAHFQKMTEWIDDDRYQVRLRYEKNDEAEIIIRILSFGPLIKVIEPEYIVNKIRDRLIRQKKFGI